ncbi:MAG: hypothetical protein ACOX02_03435 [Acholeplasmatales bacterium]
MKKYTKSNITTLILMVIGALIHFGFVKKEIFIYEVWFFMPLILLLVLLPLMIIEKKSSLKVFTILKMVLLMFFIVLLGYIYIDAIINYIPNMQDVFDFFYGEGWRVAIFVIFFVIPLVVFIGISVGYFLPLLLLIIAFIMNLIVTIKQIKELKRSNTVNLN